MPSQVWSKYRGLHGDAPGIQRNQWAAAEVRKVDGDFASYTVSEGGGSKRCLLCFANSR